MTNRGAGRDPLRLLAVAPDPAAPVFARTIGALAKSYDVEVRPSGEGSSAEPAPPSAVVRAYLAWDRRRFGREEPPVETTAEGPEAGPRDETGSGTSRFALALSFADRASARRIAERTDRGCVHVEGIGDSGLAELGAVLAGASVLESRIVLYEPDGGDLALATHRSRAHPISPARTREAHRAKLHRAVVRAVEEVLSAEAGAPVRPPGGAGGPRAAARTGAPPARPGAATIAKLVPRLIARRLEGTVHDRLRYRHWQIGVLRGDHALDRLLEGGRLPVAELLVPPPDRFWADPFVVPHEDGHFVFFEEWIFREQKAHISCLSLPARGGATPARRVLERPFHLSYPFVFRWRGSWYMLPEATASGSSTLYRADAFPGGWEPAGSVFPDSSDLGTRLADATLHQQGDLWWLFGVVQRDREDGRDEDLHLFWSDSPLGPWTPHRRNPVVTDPATARPAGPLLRWNGRLLRPAQDCAGRYGRRISVMEVRRLDTDAFEEAPFSTIEPTWAPGLTRTHTLGSCPGLVVLDGARDRIGHRPPH